MKLCKQALLRRWHAHGASKLRIQVYMLPEASGSGGLRLYRAEEFPLVWKLDRLLLDKPLIDASLLEVMLLPH